MFRCVQSFVVIDCKISIFLLLCKLHVLPIFITTYYTSCSPSYFVAPKFLNAYHLCAHAKLHPALLPITCNSSMSLACDYVHCL